MSPALSLLPATARPGRATADNAPVTSLDIVHDHVLRIVGDAETTHRLLLDVVLRANARTAELGEPSTLPVLLRLARARLAPLHVDHLDAAHLASLAPSGDPAARAVATGLAVPGERAASLLDLTVRHEMDARTAAAVLDLDVRQVAPVRAEALRQVRAALAAVGGDRIDVEGTLAALPVVPAPSALHDRLAAHGRRRVPTALAWLAPPAALVALSMAVLVGLPDVLANAVDGDVPSVAAEILDDSATVRQLVADGNGLPTPTDDEVVVRPSTPTADDAPAESSPASSTDTVSEPTPAPTPTPTDEPSPDEPTADPTADPSPRPSPGPSTDPLDELLPTGP